MCECMCGRIRHAMASVDSKDKYTLLATLVSLVVNVSVRFHLNFGEIISTPFLNLC